MRNALSRNLKNILLVILPTIMLMLGLLMHFSRGNFYMMHVDPEYFHLFNGLNLAIFNLAVDFIDHPGTALQMIYALSAHVVNLIFPNSGLISNALDDPEMFIHGASILLNLITAMSLFGLGWFTYRYTGNLLLALLLQLMPWGSYSILSIMGRLIPETAMIAPLLMLCLLTVKYLNDKDHEISYRFYIVGFALIGGLGMAAKFLYLPFLLIPLFILPGWRIKLKYMGYTLLATIIFAFPVFVNIGKSVRWFGSLFLHSGKWGSGEATIFDVSAASKALAEMIHSDLSFFLILGITVLLIILLYVFSRQKQLPGLRKLLPVSSGFVFAIIISILLIAKHYTPHYLIPTLLMKFFLLFLIAEMIIHYFNKVSISRITSATILFTGIILAWLQVVPLADTASRLRKQSQRFEERKHVLDAYPSENRTLIISSHYRGSVFMESAMVAGFLTSGALKSTFQEKLLEKYPDTYFYYSWSDRFFLWDEFLYADEFIQLNKPVYLFIGEGMEDNLFPIMERLEKAFPDLHAEAELLHRFDSPVEYFYRVKFTNE